MRRNHRMMRVIILLMGIMTTVAMASQHDKHGRVQMGVSNHDCDDGETNLEIDWDPSSTSEYTCQNDERNVILTDSNIKVVEDCLLEENIPIPEHICMNERIDYEDQLPTSGSHRPLWPKYGEYIYVPPQRWLHSLEHGAAVFLYHPCADENQVDKLRELATNCLRRHIISPYRGLDVTRPYAVVTYGCKLLMNNVDGKEVTDFVKRHALAGPEQVSKDGQYGVGLITPARNVTDVYDRELCPSVRDRLDDFKGE